MADRSNRELSRHWTVYLRRGILASVGIHVLLVLAFRSGVMPDSPFAAAGPRAGDDAAAAGGGTELLAVRPPPPEPLQPVPVPLPEITFEPELPEETEPVPEPPVLEVDLPGESTVERSDRAGEAARQGLPDGAGRGDGGTADEGRFRGIPPSPRGLILPPPDRPRNVRGIDVTVWVFITESGSVVADSTRLDPATGNTRFDRRLKEQAAEWLFEPAKRGGRAVAEWYSYVITL